MAQGSSNAATRAAESSVPLVPLMEKSPAATGATMEVIISKKITQRMGMNPFSVSTNVKMKGASPTVEAPLNVSWIFYRCRNRTLPALTENDRCAHLHLPGVHQADITNRLSRL